MENLIHLNNALRVEDGKDSKNYSFTAFRDDMLARKVHDLHVPKHLEEFVLKSDRYAAMELTAELQYINCVKTMFVWFK